VLPGLIDMHTHLTNDAKLGGYNALGVSDTRAALYGVRAARLTLEAGFTSVRNVGAGGFGDVALRDAINDGDFIGPRMRTAAYAIGIQGGHCDENLLPPDEGHRPWRGRRPVGSPRQGARDGQIRRRCDQDLRFGRCAVERR
jgi:imidazolonepropionase-like amidohydrolase